MTTKKEDRRVQRTRQMLSEALFSLIEERGFEALSVQNIIDRANIGRATFYAHFDNKEDLLTSGLDGLRSRLKDHQRQAHVSRAASDERLFAFSRELFDHVAAYRHIFRAMVGKESGAMVQQILHKMMLDLVREEVKSLRGRNDSGSAVTEVVVQFLAGGLFGVLLLWADGKLRLSVDEANALFRRLAIPAMKAALR